MRYTSTELLNKLYAQTEKHIDKAISVWQTTPGAIFNHSAAAGKWSAAQCLEHLNSYSRYYLPAIEKALQAAQKPPAGIFKSGWLGNYFFQLMLTDSAGNARKKMKSPKYHRPPDTLNAVGGLTEFISQLEKLGTLLTLAQQVNLNELKVPVSIAPFIKLKLGDTFLFYTAHIQRHVLQADRALQAAGAINKQSATF